MIVVGRTYTPVVILGFSSYNDGEFELIVQDEKTGEETTLEGNLKPGQFEIIHRILPSCVFIQTRCESRSDGEIDNA